MRDALNRSWIIPITGFTESTRRPTGTEAVWGELLAFSSPSVRVATPLVWSADMEAFVRFVLRNSGPSKPRLMVTGYSWGAGVGAMRLAEACYPLGLTIEMMLLCDPVYRSRLLPDWLPFNPRSVATFWRPEIVVPRSVDKVVWMRQAVSVPSGHDLRAAFSGVTTIRPPVISLADHCSIDDTPEWRDMVLEAAQEFIGGDESEGAES